MDSLTTSYLVGMFIGSVGAVAAAFTGNKIYPIESSKIIVPAVEPATSVSPPQNTVQTPPVISSEAQ